MKNLFFFAACITLLCGCKQNTAINEPSAHETKQWYVYNNPVNGFNVSVFARMYDTTHYCSCEITVFLKKGDTIYSIKQLADYNSFYFESSIEDTIYIDNPTDKYDNIILDYRTTVSCADVNFDGIDELIVCGCPRKDRELSSVLKQEIFCFYSIREDSLERLHNVLFDRLSQGNDVIEYTFDSKQKTISLIEQFNDLGTITEVFWFKDGYPFKVDFKYDYQYLHGKPVDQDSLFFHFNLPTETERYKHLKDSVILLI